MAEEFSVGGLDEFQFAVARRSTPMGAGLVRESGTCELRLGACCGIVVDVAPLHREEEVSHHWTMYYAVLWYLTYDT